MRKLEEKRILKLANDLLTHPELGYKEYKTKEYLVEYLKENGFEIENECFETAFSVSVGSGHPHIGLIAELDAIPTIGHKYANLDDNNAAHSCGHFSQCVIMASVMTLLKKESFKGKVTLFFTPAEEYTDLAYREKLIKEGKINYVGGKINMLTKGLFDDVDMFIHAHAKSESNYKFSIGSNLAGFIYKKITFKGKAAHASVAPHLGVNALNMYALFNDALNMLRETFKDDDNIRVHGFISNGGQTVNSIPEKVVYECYVRANNNKSLLDTALKVDNAASHCAKALGGSSKIDTSLGYLPFISDNNLSDVAYKQMLKVVSDYEIKKDGNSMAAGDIGDLSVFKPCIQMGYGGFSGIPHGKDFEVKDNDLAFFKPIEIIFNTVKELLDNKELTEIIIQGFKPRMTYEEYTKLICNRH